MSGRYAGSIARAAAGCWHGTSSIDTLSALSAVSRFGESGRAITGYDNEAADRSVHHEYRLLQRRNVLHIRYLFHTISHISPARQSKN